MKRSMLIKVIAVAATSLVLFGGVASAADTTVNTSLSIHANKNKVVKGHRVTISGTLSSANAKCRKNQLILLKGQGETDRTSQNGGYSFTVKVNKKTTYKTKFDGSILGTHPNQTICNKSHSGGVTVGIK